MDRTSAVDLIAKICVSPRRLPPSIKEIMRLRLAASFSPSLFYPAIQQMLAFAFGSGHRYWGPRTNDVSAKFSLWTL